MKSVPVSFAVLLHSLVGAVVPTTRAQLPDSVR